METLSIKLTITSGTSTLKTNIENVVTVYNNLQSLLSNLGSERDTFTNAMNCALAKDSSMINKLKSKFRSAILADSGTKSGDITALRYMGVSLSQTENRTFNEAKYSAAI